ERAGISVARAGGLVEPPESDGDRIGGRGLVVGTRARRTALVGAAVNRTDQRDRERHAGAPQGACPVHRSPTSRRSAARASAAAAASPMAWYSSIMRLNV